MDTYWLLGKEGKEGDIEGFKEFKKLTVYVGPTEGYTDYVQSCITLQKPLIQSFQSLTDTLYCSIVVNANYKIGS